MIPWRAGDLVGREAAVPVAQHRVGARPDDRDALVNPVLASGSVFAAFFSSTTVLRVTSSARVLYSAVFHGVSVPAMLLYGTRAGGSRVAEAEAHAQVRAQRRVDVRHA